MNTDKWKSFEMSGRIDDYLKYKGVSSALYSNSNSESEYTDADNIERNSYKGTHSGGEG